MTWRPLNVQEPNFIWQYCSSTSSVALLTSPCWGLLRERWRSTILFVEREKLDVHRARALVDRRRDPQYVTGDDINVTNDDVIVSNSFIRETSPELMTSSFRGVTCPVRRRCRRERHSVCTWLHIYRQRCSHKHVKYLIVHILLTTFVFRLHNDINVLLSRKEIHHRKTQYIGCNCTSATKWPFHASAAVLSLLVRRFCWSKAWNASTSKPGQFRRDLEGCFVLAFRWWCIRGILRHCIICMAHIFIYVQEIMQTQDSRCTQWFITDRQFACDNSCVKTESAVLPDC